ncbi:hypothetical protein C0J52_16497 [Blattella germanica]|nr:hypothetical protein C0J52_16497 [Blattella germanica]
MRCHSSPAPWLSGLRQRAFDPDHVTHSGSSPHGEEIFSWISSSIWDRCSPSIICKSTALLFPLINNRNMRKILDTTGCCLGSSMIEQLLHKLLNQEEIDINQGHKSNKSLSTTYSMQLEGYKNFNMALSWIFGGSSKKKSTDTAAATENNPDIQGDDSPYVFIERAVRAEEDSKLYPTLPYAIAPQHSTQPSVTNNAANIAQNQNQNFLYGVPFKLSSDATSLSTDSVSSNIIHANEVLSHITQLSMESFDYDFLVERSVVIE